MHEAGEASAVNYVLTLEEISNLAREGRQAGRDADERGRADRRGGFRPTSARPTCWSRTAPTWCWPRRSACGRNASARCAWRCTKGCGPGGRAGAAGGRRTGARIIRASSTSTKPAKTPTNRSSGVPLIDRGVLQGVLVVQTIEAAHLSRRRNSRCWRRRPRRWRRWSARRARSTASSRPRRSGSGRWPATCGGAGTTIPPACSATSIPVRWRQLNHNPIALLARDSAGASSSAAPASWCCTAASTTPTAASRNICRRTAPGARRTPAFCGRGRWRISRPSSACTNRFPIYSGGLGVLAGDHIKSASDLGIPLVGVGLFYGQGYFRQRLDRNGWQQEEYLADRRQPAADGTGHRHRTASRSRCRSRRAAARSAPRSGA